MDSSTPLNSKHLRNAETQMAVDLSNAVDRFVKAKKNRLALAEVILVKARELAQASLLLNSEPTLPQPIPPLAPSAERRSSLLIMPGGFHSDQWVDGWKQAEQAVKIWSVEELEKRLLAFPEGSDGAKGVLAWCAGYRDSIKG